MHYFVNKFSNNDMQFVYMHKNVSNIVDISIVLDNIMKAYKRLQ